MRIPPDGAAFPANDSIYYDYFQPYHSAPCAWHTDTLALHPMQLKKVRLIGDQLLGLYGTYSLTRCRYVFEKGDAPRPLLPKDHLLRIAVIRSLTSWYLILRPRGWTRYMNSEALTIMRLQHQRLIKTRFQRKRPRLVKNIAWFTPSKATENKRPHNGASNQHG